MISLAAPSPLLHTLIVNSISLPVGHGKTFFRVIVRSLLFQTIPGNFELR
jgi:hypothetical protein